MEVKTSSVAYLHSFSSAQEKGLKSVNIYVIENWTSVI